MIPAIPRTRISAAITISAYGNISSCTATTAVLTGDTAVIGPWIAVNTEA